MSSYCGPCGRRVWGDQWADGRPWGDFTGEIREALWSLRNGGAAEFGVRVCEGGHWFVWRVQTSGVETATLPYRPGERPTWGEVLEALRGEEVPTDADND